MKARWILTALAACAAATALVFAADRPAEVPFELFYNVILVEVHLGEHGPYLAMVDTGTDPSAIDIALAKELGLPFGAGGEIDAGGTQTVRAFETKLPSVSLGAVSAKDVEALASESIAKIGAKLGRPLRLVLGKSFLNGRIVQFDFPKKVLRFPPAAPDVAETPGRRAVLRFRYLDDVELEGVRINGKSVRAILDTGSNGSLKLTPEAIQKLGLGAQAKAGKESESTGYRGTYASREGRLESLDLGKIHVDSPEATFWQPGTGHDGKPWDVNIGNAVLKDFVMTLDSVHGVLVIERR